MNKNICTLMIFILMFSLTACSGITKEQYEEVSLQLEDTKLQLSDAQSDNRSLTSKLDSLQKDYDTLKNDTDLIKSENKEYEKIIQPYKDLSTAEVALKAKATEAELEKFAAEEEKKAAEEKAAEEAEAKKGYNTGITYSQLARTPDDYFGKKVKFKGEVIQVIEGSSSIQLRLTVDFDYDQVVLLEYDKYLVKSRILEGDTITIYGVSLGLISYQSTMSGTITIPSIMIDKVDQ